MTEKAAEKLESLRVEHDWTYGVLAIQIKKETGRHRNEDCWRKICRGESVNPRPTTLAILDKFLRIMSRKNDLRKVAV